jgi:hypothetical protein
MGANASTAVPVYASGEVLDAARLNLTNCGIPVFSGTATRDAAFGGSGEKVLAEGQVVYLEDTDALQYYSGTSFVPVGVAPGLVLVATSTITAVASVSINNCFTSTYENYRIVFSATGVTVASDLSFRLRASGTDTTTSYKSVTLEAASSITSTTDITGTDEFYVGRIDTPVGTSFAADVYRPQLAQKTGISCFMFFQSAAPLFVWQSTQGFQTSSTQFDGFTLAVGGTNFTGTVRVYGYANS